MFYPARMKRVHIITHSQYIERLTAALHESGPMEIDPVNISGLKRRSVERTWVEDNLLRVRTIFENIRYEEPISIKKFILHPQPPEVFDVPEQTENSINEMAESLLPKIEKQMEYLLDKKNATMERISELEIKKGEVLPLRGMKFDLSLIGEGEHATIMAGISGDIDALKKALSSQSGLIELYYAGTKGDYSVVIVAHNSEIDKVEKAKRQRLLMRLR